MLARMLHHVLHLLANKGLDYFVPEWLPQRELYQGEGIMNMPVAAVDEMGILRAVRWPSSSVGFKRN